MNKFTIVKTLVLLQAFWAAFFSFMHIVSVARHFEMGWQSWAVPIVVDGLAVLGMLGRDHAAREVRRAATALAAVAGTVSLACNVFAGENIGQRIWGVVVVGGFVAAEAYLTVLLRNGNATKPAPAAMVSDEVKAMRSERARKAAATRKRNAEAAKKAERAAARAARTPKAPADTAEAARMLAEAGTAPVSPAPAGSASFERVGW